MKIEFKCPECGSDGLEEVMVNVTSTSFVNDIEIEDGVINCDYDNVEVEDGEVDHYQCVDCGSFLKINGDVVKGLIGLALWFEKNQ